MPPWITLGNLLTIAAVIFAAGGGWLRVGVLSAAVGELRNALVTEREARLQLWDKLSGVMNGVQSELRVIKETGAAEGRLAYQSASELKLTAAVMAEQIKDLKKDLIEIHDQVQVLDHKVDALEQLERRK